MAYGEFHIPIKKAAAVKGNTIEPLVLERAASTLSLYLKDGHWHVTSTFHKPYERQRTSMFDAYYERMLYGYEPERDMESVTDETHRVNEFQLLNLLTPDECRLLLGYCAHILEQGMTHLAYMHTAVGEALERKDWSAMMAQLPEFYDEVRTHEAVRSLAATILTSEDVHT